MYCCGVDCRRFLNQLWFSRTEQVLVWKTLFNVKRGSTKEKIKKTNIPAILLLSHLVLVYVFLLLDKLYKQIQYNKTLFAYTSLTKAICGDEEKHEETHKISSTYNHTQCAKTDRGIYYICAWMNHLLFTDRENGREERKSWSKAKKAGPCLFFIPLYIIRASSNAIWMLVLMFGWAASERKMVQGQSRQIHF